MRSGRRRGEEHLHERADEHDVDDRADPEPLAAAGSTRAAPRARRARCTQSRARSRSASRRPGGTRPTARARAWRGPTTTVPSEISAMPTSNGGSAAPAPRRERPPHDHRGARVGRPLMPAHGSARRRVGVEIQDGGGCVRSVDPGHAVPFGPSSAARTGGALRASGTIASTCRGAERARARDRDRAGRHVGERREVPLPHLLLLAAVVELDDLHDERIVEVGDRRIVEREVTVLADAEAAHVDRMVDEQLRVARGLGVGVGARHPGRSGTRRTAGPRRPARACSAGSSRGASAGGRRTRPCGSP